MTEPIQITTEQLVARYIELRDEIAQAKAAFEAETAVLADHQSAVLEALIARANEAGADSLKTKAGTLIKKSQQKYITTDIGALVQYIRETGRVELLQARMSTTAVAEMVQEGTPLPSCIGQETVISYTVRKA